MANFGSYLKYFFFPPSLLYDALTGNGAFEKNNKDKQQQNNNSQSNTETSKDKIKNVYNYYGIDDGEYGNTLFNSQKKKRSLFQDENTQVTNTRRFV
nr:MAG TPA: hypothetical protein [Caudoviricetes sp.]